MNKSIILSLIIILTISCSKNDNTIDVTPTQPESMYFPPLAETTWTTTSIASLGWKQSGVQPLLDYLAQKNTKSFMILVNGKIILENYFNGHNATLP